MKPILLIAFLIFSSGIIYSQNKNYNIAPTFQKGKRNIHLNSNKQGKIHHQFTHDHRMKFKLRFDSDRKSLHARKNNHDMKIHDNLEHKKCNHMNNEPLHHHK